MASGYVTSDGKDLDERYLAIDAKAKSSETADVAQEAIGLVNNRFISETGVFVFIQPSAYQTKTWQAPSDGILSGYLTGAPSNVDNIHSFAVNDGAWFSFGLIDKIPSGTTVAFILKKGDSVKIKSTYNDDKQPSLKGVFFAFENR